MADMYGRDRAGNGVQARMYNGRGMGVMPWVQACILDGLGYGFEFGSAQNSVTTVGTFGAGGADLDEFDMLVTLPSNGLTAILPIYWKPVLEAIGTIAAVDCLLVYGAGGVISNGISATPANLRQGSAALSGCTVAGLGDDGGTVITVEDAIYREGGTHLTGVAATGQTLFPEWSISKDGFAPVVEGVSKQIAGFASGQASTGFMNFKYLEFASADL